MRAPDRSAGFTLIELSIVLVIIGLIVGGILVGRDMIEAAKVRATISQLEKFTTAANTFKLKYGVLPGDLSTTEATAIGLAPTTRTPGNNIPDDGWIETSGGCAAFCVVLRVDYEGAAFWSDLSQANLISASIAPHNFGAQAYTIQTLSSFIPTAPLDGNYWFIYAIGGTQSDNGYTAPPKSGTWLQLSGVTLNGAQIVPADRITPLQALSIDTKIDDGVFYTGSVVANDNPGASNSFYPDQANTGGAGTCADSGGNKSLNYDTFDSRANKPGCELSFFFTQ